MSSTCTGPVGRQRRTSWLPGTISPTPAATSGPRPPTTTIRQQYQKRWTATTSSPYRLITARTGTPAIIIVREEKQKTSPNFLKIIEILLFSGEGVALLFLNGGLAERSSPFLANDFEKTENIFFRVHYEQIIVYVDDFS